ncbi:hypothetical protein SLE2022_300080 [Rubroshorea leprosula]
MELEREQQLEWIEAQKIEISTDLVAAAKQQLKFLQAVDRNRWLYDGPALQRAIYRYSACWLPLLAKHCESEVSEGPLVVPLDCEWIWHCHRLNPVRYKSDCVEFYGRILDNFNVVSSLQGSCKKQTEEIWNTLFLDEPYEFDWKRALSEDISEKFSGIEKQIKYDLISAVKRQSPFFYQVSRPHMNNNIFLEEAVARYKGFLHLIKRNQERSMRRFCVPTYDIDLMWHTHQLHPVAYCKDLKKELDRVLEHDDKDSDRTKGKKLDTGFFVTTKQWEETFGTRYWRAGAMYRGSAPTPVTDFPCFPDSLSKEATTTHQFQNIIQLPEVKLVEVLLEVIGVKNIAEELKGSLFVLFRKTQPDAFFNGNRKVTILSESREKQVVAFQCEPTGKLLFELVSLSPSNLLVTRASKTLGTASLSLSEFLDPVSKLAGEKWLELTPVSGSTCPKPMNLRVAVSFTIPTPAPYVLRMVRYPCTKSTCFFPLPVMVEHAKNWRHVIDETQAEVISLQIRELTEAKKKQNCTSRKQVIGITKCGETHILAEFTGTFWLLMDSQWCLQHQEKASENGDLLELIGSRMVKVYPGRKLEYEPKPREKQRNEDDFMTLVEFSAENPYGKALALLDLRSGYIKATEEWLVLPGLIAAFILSDNLKKKGHISFNVNGKNRKEINDIIEKVDAKQDHGTNMTLPAGTKVDYVDLAAGKEMNPENAVKSSGCGGCGAGCGNIVNSGGCGSGCGGGCGSGCGGGCGNMFKSAGCGAGCGGCGGGCGSGSGNMVSDNDGACGNAGVNGPKTPLYTEAVGA